MMKHICLMIGMLMALTLVGCGGDDGSCQLVALNNHKPGNLACGYMTCDHKTECIIFEGGDNRKPRFCIVETSPDAPWCTFKIPVDSCTLSLEQLHDMTMTACPGLDP